MSRFIKDYKFYFCKILNKAGILEKLNFSLTNTRGNKTFKIPVINCAGYTHLTHHYEPWFDNFLKVVLKNPDAVVIDVGVNIGQTILKIASFKNDVRYLGFEPNPTCYSYSRKLILANNLTNYKVFPVGLSDKVQLLTLTGDNDYAAGASVIPNFRQDKKRYRNEQVVALVDGDAILQDEALNKIDFIKVDVEGAELEVMKGLKKTIETFSPLIMLEILPVYSLQTENGKQRKERQDNLLKVMKDYNYSSYLIDEKTGSLIEVESIPVHSDMGRTNYFFIPENKREKTLQLFNLV